MAKPVQEPVREPNPVREPVRDTVREPKPAREPVREHTGAGEKVQE